MIRLKPAGRFQAIRVHAARISKLIRPRDAGILLAAVLLSRVFIIGEMAPFGAAFVAAAWLAGISPYYALAGCLIGTLTLMPQAPFAALITAGMVSAATLLFLLSRRRMKKWFMAAILVASCIIPDLFFREATLYQLVIGALEAALSTAMFFVYSAWLGFMQKYKECRVMKEEQMLCIGLTLCVTALGAEQISIPLIMPANVLAVLVGLGLAYLCGPAMGAASGATMGLALTLGGARGAEFVCGMALSAMMAGVFRSFRKTGVIAGFALTNLLVSMYLTGFTAAVIPLADVGLASIILLLIPRRKLELLAVMMDTSAKRNHEQKHFMKQLRDTGAAKLQEIARILRQMAYAFGTDMERQKNKPAASAALTGKQLYGAADIIRALSKEIHIEKLFKSDIEDMIRDALEESGVTVCDVVVQQNPAGRLQADLEVKSCAGKELCRSLMGQEISSIVGKPMRNPDTACRVKRGKCRLTFTEFKALDVETGAVCRAAENSGVCGDSHLSARFTPNRHILCVADGMGSGEKARDASRTTLSLIESFLRAGYDEMTTFSVINRLLMYRGGEEVYSTVDLCTVDMSDSCCEFTKIGAPPSFIVRNNEIEAVLASTLPIGIVEEITPHCLKKSVAPGESIVMMSDGAYECLAGQGNLPDVLSGAVRSSRNARECAAAILSQALKHPNSGNDDMTVVVGRIKGTLCL